jgi:hypothetical protein
MMDKLKNIFGFNKNSYNDSLKQMKLYGELHLKEIGRKPQLLSEDCVLSLTIKNEKEFDYTMHLYNGEYQFEGKSINLNKSKFNPIF